MTWKKGDAMIVAAGLTTGMLATIVIIFVRWILLGYTISSLGWALLLLLIVTTGLCITIAWGYVVGKVSVVRVPTYSRSRFAKPEKKETIETIETIVHQALCGVTYDKTTTDKASNFLLQNTEIAVTATTPEEVERLFEFVKQHAEEDCDGE